MLILSGAPALSDFRCRKLQENLRLKLGFDVAVYAEYVHFVKLNRDLSATDHSLLCRLLTYGPRRSSGNKSGVLRLVVPRIGTQSPWSSKATDIAQSCGLSDVARIERGIAYYLEADASNQLSASAADPCLFDRMTETLLDRLEDAQQLFTEQAPREFETVALTTQGIDALRQANARLGLALAEDEMDYLTASYSDLHRDATDVELMMFAQANSEHCRHKIFNASWTLDGEPQDDSLFGMIRHTNAVGGENVLSAYSDNAAVVEGSLALRFFPLSDHKYQFVEEDIHLLMKVETHNHPTAIAPFAGAGTGSGGEIRDEGAVGRGSKPKAGLCGFSVSNLRIPSLPQAWESPESKPDRIVSPLEIMLQGPIGAAAFNNEFGRPNLCGYFRSFELRVNGETYGYHKPIMIAGGYGNIRAEHVEKHPFAPGCKLIVLGGPAMLIGLGGGAASSVASGQSTEELDFSSVQRQNPEMERRCQEVIDACWAMGEESPIAFIHDVGAGGLSNALPELVKDGGTGGRFELRKVPCAESGMSPLEIWCNEAQERYVLAVKPAKYDTFVAICERERAPYAAVGVALEEDHVELSDSLFGSKPVDIPKSLLFGKPPKMHRDAVSSMPIHSPLAIEGKTVSEVLNPVLQHPAVAAKSFLITIGDRSITGMVARDQMVGPHQVPVANCAVTTTSFQGFTGEAMAMGERTPLAVLSGPASGRMAIGESLTNIGCTWLGEMSKVKLSANWMCAAGHQGEDASLFKTVEAVAKQLCPQLGLTIPVGKDSMSMRTAWQSAEGEPQAVTSPVSLVISAFAPVLDVRKTVTPELDVSQPSQLYLFDFAEGKQRLGGSILAQTLSQLGRECPDLDSPAVFKAGFAFLQAALRDNLIAAYHDRSDGGLVVSLLEMAFAARCGLQIDVPCADTQAIAALFNEELGVVLQVCDSRREAFEALAQLHGVDALLMPIGHAETDQRIEVRVGGTLVLSDSRANLQRTWARTSYEMQKLRDNPDCADEEFSLIESDAGRLTSRLTFDPNENPAAAMINSGARPRVAVLREQGVNGQLEMAAAFALAGFDAIDVHMSDLQSGRQRLADFSALVACGGFSFGDVLGAGEGWAKSILFRAQLRDQFEAFFARPDTLSLGICNGCQMMSNLAELIPGAAHWPRFVTNRSEQFEARVSLLRIESSQSVWLSGMCGSVLPVAVAHGEGCAEFVSPQQAQHLVQSAQISARYCDGSGQATQLYPLNPNGSPDAIASVSSGDGRVTIMMPHPERVFRSVTNSWQDPAWGDDGPWMRLFRNARASFD